ncbi:MAG: hypothetical protein ACI4J0_00345 [Huintestinicola sp.]|uniref:hypothetical protein n=1 Tax=Huintestinicola sp. TaxID=2981661 RepID=UPI003F0A9952
MADKNEKNTYKTSKLQILLSAIILLLCTAGAFVTEDLKLIIAGLIGGVICLSVKRGLRKRDYFARVLAFLIAEAFIFSTPPFLSSSSLWRYPIQRGYIGLYSNIREPEAFPDFRPDAESGYRFDYMPSILQGAGHYSVCFVTSPEKAAGYAERYSQTARYVISLEEYDGRYSVSDTEEIVVYTDKEFWSEPSGAQIYVCETNLSFNHPHTFAVIVDKDRGMVQLSQEG